MNKISIAIYGLVVLLVGYFLYQYPDLSLYILGITGSFILLNKLLFLWYTKSKQKTMAVMRFMAFNFAKDLIWAVVWMFLFQKNQVLALFLGANFLLLSIPLYISVLKEMGNSKKSDKNQ